MTVRAVIYARCSTEDESQKDALSNQIREAKECVRAKGWMLVDTYIESRSGTTTKGRTEYNRLYDDLQKDLFDVIVIKSQDRLMRNTKDWYLFVDRLCTSGKKLYIYIEGKFYTTDDALITGIKAILAEEYSRELSKKINNAHRNRQKNGGSVILTPNAYGFRKMSDKSVELVESEAQVKRQMYELCVDGYGSRAIANILTNEGIRKRSGKEFSGNDVLRILRNPLNMGTAVMNRKHFDFETKQVQKVPQDQQFIYENKVPATVSHELWLEANKAIDIRSRKYGKSVYPAGSNPGKYDLSGKIVCGICGSVYYRRFRKNYKEQRTVIEWKCSTYLLEGRKSETKARPQVSKVRLEGEKGCDNIHLDEEKLFVLLEKVCLERFQIDREEVIGETITLLKQVLEEHAGGKQLEDLVEEEKRIEKQQDFLVDRFLGGVITEEVYRRKQERLEEALQTCREKKRRLEKENIQIQSRKQRIAEIEKRLKEGGSVERASVNEMLREIERIVIYPSCMEIVYDPVKALGIDGGVQSEKAEETLSQKLTIPYGTMFDPMARKREEREKVIEMIREHPQITARDIALHLGCSLSGANYKLKVLKREGRIRFTGRGGHGFWEVLGE